MDETSSTKLTKVKTIDWQTIEYHHYERSSDWFWVVGLGGLLSVIISIVFLNFLFAVVIVIATFSVMMFASRPPGDVFVSINRRGIQINNELYPYKNIKAFALREDEDPDLLILHVDRMFLPHVSVFIENIDTKEIRNYLAEFLPEEPYEDYLIELILDRLGF